MPLTNPEGEIFSWMARALIAAGSHTQSAGPTNRNRIGKGASSGAARRETVRPEELRSPESSREAVVARENLLKAYAQVMINKGAAGVDEMPVEQLMPYLQEH